MTAEELAAQARETAAAAQRAEAARAQAAAELQRHGQAMARIGAGR